MQAGLGREGHSTSVHVASAWAARPAAIGSASGGSLAGEPGPLFCLPLRLPGSRVAGPGVGEPGGCGEGLPVLEHHFCHHQACPGQGRAQILSLWTRCWEDGAGRGALCAATFGRHSHPGWWGLAQRLTEVTGSLRGVSSPLCPQELGRPSSLKMGLRLPPVRPFLEEPFGGFCRVSTGALSPLWVLALCGRGSLRSQPAGPATDTRDWGVNSRSELLTVPEAGSPRSKCRQGGFLLHPSLHVLTWPPLRARAPVVLPFL